MLQPMTVGTGEQKELTDIQDDEGAVQGMLSYKRLGEHGLLVPDASPSRSSTATDFPLYVEVRAGVLSHADHQAEEPEPSCCARK